MHSIPQSRKRLHFFAGFARINDERQPAQRQANKNQDDEENYALLIQPEKDFFSFCHDEATSGKDIPHNRTLDR